MAIKVLVGEAAWNGFLRRAKSAFPNEHIEALWGEETIDSFRITDFKHVKINKATHSGIDYDDAEMKRQKWLAQKADKTFLGTVHTHPHADYDTAPSQTDHHDGSKDGEKVMGVVVLYKKKDSNRFIVEHDWWVPQPKIEFEILPE